MTGEEQKRMGQVAYEGYCLSSKGVSLVSGAQLPPWTQLSPEIQQAWVVSAQAVITKTASAMSGFTHL
jgi:hypothetical protein